ncbi:MAG: type II secretion system protein GspM, partial [Geminicoccaceae bacterium]
EIAQSNELLQRYQALASERSVLSERLAAFKEDDQVLSGYLEGPSDALAAAQLQDLAADAIAAAGGEILSTQILQAADVEDGPPSIRKTGLKLRFAATIDGLASALYDLETIEPRLFVDQLLVVSTDGRRRSDRDNSNSNLDVRLDLFGYVLQAE